MKQKVKRSTAQTRAKRANPRYLISRDGVEVGIYPGFTSVEAVKRAKAQYGRGKYTAEKISADLYLGRGGEDIAARERLQRREEYRAERLSKARRNPRNLASKEELMRIIMDQKLDVHPHPRGKYPYTVDWKFRDGKIFATVFPDRTALVDSAYLHRRNGTHIHAENIDHLDVSRVHNPDANRNKAAYYTLLHIYGGKANIPTLSYFLRDVKTADQDYRRIMGGASPPTLRALNMDPGPGSTTDDTLSMVKARYHEIENTLGQYSALSDMHYVSQMLLTDAHMAESRLSDVMEENPARPVTRYEYTLGTWWQPYIAYGDDSDVSIEEIQQWEAFRKRLPPGGHWSFTEDTYFGKDEITGKRGDVSDAYYVIVG